MKALLFVLACIAGAAAVCANPGGPMVSAPAYAPDVYPPPPTLGCDWYVVDEVTLELIGCEDDDTEKAWEWTGSDWLSCVYPINGRGHKRVRIGGSGLEHRVRLGGVG